MTENMKEELIMEETEIKDEEISIKKEICSSSSLEETCTWDVQEEDVKMENTEIKGKVKVLRNIYFAPLFLETIF